MFSRSGLKNDKVNFKLKEIQNTVKHSNKRQEFLLKNLEISPLKYSKCLDLAITQLCRLVINVKCYQIRIEI